MGNCWIRMTRPSMKENLLPERNGWPALEELARAYEADGGLKRIYVCVAVQEPTVVAALEKAAGRLSTEKTDYHLTLRYIRQLLPAQLPRLAEAVAEIGRRSQPFELSLGRPGSFPGVAWYGLKPSAQLMTLQTEIDEAVLALEVPTADYRYNPHITLARVKTAEPEILCQPSLSWPVETLEIRQSKTGQAGSRTLYRVRLG